MAQFIKSGLLLVSLGIILSCHSVKRTETSIDIKECGIGIAGIPQYKNIKHNWHIDSLEVSIKEFIPDEKPIFCRKGSSVLLTSPIANNIYQVNITNGEILETIPLVREPGYIKSVSTTCNCSEDLKKDIQGISFFKDNQLVIQREGILDIMDKKGNIIKTILLNDLKDTKQKFMYSNIYESPVYYDSINDVVRTFRYCFQCYARSKEAYSKSILASIEPNTNGISEENFYYPEIFSKYHLGFNDVVYSSDFAHYRFFSFHPDHTIYVYDYNKRQTFVYPGLSPNAYNCIKPLDKKQSNNELELLKQVMNQESYCQPVFDESNKKFYRMFRRPASVTEAARTVISELYVQIFDENFNHLDEINIPTGSIYYYSIDGGIQWPSYRNGSVMLYSLTFKEVR